MAKSIRTYICTGCGIGECLKAEKLAEVSTSEFGLESKVHPPLCVPEGVEFLQKDIEEAGVDHAVIAACSERVNWDVFSTDSLGVKMVERVNIREQVAWSKAADDEETQLLAEDYLRMGIVHAQKSEPPSAKIEPTERALLVVGGGVTGLTAALEAAEAGSEVILVEKQDRLGGWMAGFHRLYPTRPPYRELEPVNIEEKISAVQNHPRIRVLTSAEVERISGRPGAFELTVRQKDESISTMAGSVVLATGWQPYDPSHLEYLGLRHSAKCGQQPENGRAGVRGLHPASVGRQRSPERAFRPEGGFKNKRPLLLRLQRERSGGSQAGRVRS